MQPQQQQPQQQQQQQPQQPQPQQPQQLQQPQHSQQPQHAQQQQQQQQQQWQQRWQQAQLLAALRQRQQEELLQLLVQVAPQQLLLIEVQGQARLMTRCIGLQQSKLKGLQKKLKDDERRLQQQQPLPQALAQVQDRLKKVDATLQQLGSGPFAALKQQQPQGTQMQQQLDQLAAREQTIQEMLERQKEQTDDIHQQLEAQLQLLASGQLANQQELDGAARGLHAQQLPLAQLQADVLQQQLGLQAAQQQLQRVGCQLQKLVPLVVQPSQQRDANQQQMQLYNALIVVAGLLLSATYSAMYASPVPDGKTSDLDWSIRMVNGVAFGLSLICVVSCLMNLLRLCYVTPLSGSDSEVLQCFGKGRLLSEWAENIMSSMFLVAIASFVLAVGATVVASVLAATRIMGHNIGLWGSAIAWFVVAGIMCAVFVGRYNCFKRVAFKH